LLVTRQVIYHSVVLLVKHLLIKFCALIAFEWSKIYNFIKNN